MRLAYVLSTLGLLVLAGIVESSANAQESAALTLTLEEAIQRAAANSMRLAELEARHEAAQAAEAGSAAARLPVVALQSGYTRTNHVQEFAIAQPGQPLRILYPDVPDNYRGRVDLQWPIYTAGRADALERAARAEQNAAAQDVAAARADLRLETTRAFWALVTAGETAAVLSRSLASTEAHVGDLRNRQEQGLIPPNDVLTAEARLAQERLLAIEADNARAIAEADLQRLLGISGVTTIRPDAALEPPPVAPAADPRQLLAAARDQRAERRALADRAEAAAARVDAAAAAARPQVAIGGGYDYARPNPRIFPRVNRWEDSWDASVNVTWSMWDGGRTRAERAQAAALASAVKARVTDFDRQLEFEVRQRQLELDSSRAAIDVARAGVRAAQEARRVVGDRFNAGVATSTEVLDAETDLMQAELALTRALANVRLATARVERAIGAGK
jgi:outer membrane protein TolC